MLGSGESPGPRFPFGRKGSKPQVSRAQLAFGFRNTAGYTGVKNPMKKKTTSLSDSSQMSGLPEGKGGRERKCKSQADTTACSGPADISEIGFFWDAVLLQQGWLRAVPTARACLIW